MLNVLLNDVLPNVVLLNVVLLNVILLNVILLNVIRLNVVAPSMTSTLGPFLRVCQRLRKKNLFQSIFNHCGSIPHSHLQNKPGILCMPVPGIGLA
jgi:hypothetical protein